MCPQGYCVVCTTAAMAAYDFRMLALKSEKLWTTCVESVNDIIKYPSPTQSLYSIFTKDLNVQTTKEFTGNAKDLLNQLWCKMVKRKSEPTEKKPRGLRSGPRCVCIDCDKPFLSPYYLNIHLKNSGQKESCWLCGIVKIKGQAMKEHLATVHKKEMHLCPDCPTLFFSSEELTRHLKKAHKPGALTCLDCGRSFNRKLSYEGHMQMHTVRTCRRCGAQFSNRGCYRVHRSKCEPEAKPDVRNMPRSRRSNVRDPATFICDHCGKNYQSRSQLRNHIIWIHMDVRPHQCQWCGKRFFTPARLAEHTVVHTRERNFECDLCGAKLVTKMAAIYHRRRHTGERPYECSDCGEKFISSSRRTEHAKRRHGKGVRMQCVQCPANFVRGHELRRHIEKAHRQENNVMVKAKAKA